MRILNYITNFLGAWVTLMVKVSVQIVKGNKVLFHRSVLKVNKGDGKIVDHIDGNSLNNCKTNLRICTQSENNRNRINKRVSRRVIISIRKG